MGRNKTYEELYKRAKVTAAARGHFDIAEDFAGWITLKWLEGKAQHQALDHSLTDFLRNEYGSFGRRGKRDAVLRAYRTPEAAFPGCDEQSAEESLERMYASSSCAQGLNPEPAQSDRHIDDFGAVLPFKLAQIWDLYSKEERTEKEIAFHLGVTESRISQYIIQIKKRISTFEGVARMRERIRMGEDGLEVEWLTL